MKISKRQLKRIIKEEKARLLQEMTDDEHFNAAAAGIVRAGRDTGPDRGSIRSARDALNRALTIFERMGHDEAADYVISALEVIGFDFPEGEY